MHMISYVIYMISYVIYMINITLKCDSSLSFHDT